MTQNEGWRPIETAPRDGTPIVAASSTDASMVRWWTAAQYKRAARKAGEYYPGYDYEAGWGPEGGSGHPLPFDHFTHWMPPPV